MPNMGSIWFDIEVKLSKLQEGLKQAQANINDFSKKFDKFNKVGDSIEKVGKKLTVGISLPLAGIATAAGKAAMDMETSMAKVSTIADTTAVSMDELRKGIMNLSNQTGMSTSDLAEGLYQAISAGVDTADAMKFLETAVKAAKGGFTDTLTAVDGLTTVLNAYGLTADEVTKISNQMMITQNLGKTTFGELAASIGNVIPTAAALGVKTEELFSSLAVLTMNGIGTSEAVTGLKAAFSNIIKPSEQASKLAEAIGLKFDAAALKTKGWSGFLQDVRAAIQKVNPELIAQADKVAALEAAIKKEEQAHGKNTEKLKQLKAELKENKDKLEALTTAAGGDTAALGQLFGSVEGLNSILVLTSQQGSQALNEAMSQMSGNSNATDEAFNKMSDTTQNKLDVAMQQLKNTAAELGTNLLPFIQQGAELVGKLADAIGRLTPEQQQWALGMGAVAIAAGPLLTAVGRVTKGIDDMVKIGKGVVNFGLDIGKGIAGIPDKLDTLYLKILYAKDGVSEFGSKLGEGVGKVVDFGKNLGGEVLTGLQTFGSKIGEAVTSIGNFATKLAFDAYNALTSFGTKIGEAVVSVGQFAAKLAVDAWNALASFAAQAATTAVAALTNFVAAMGSAIASAWSFTVALLANPITWVVAAIVGLIAAIVLLWKNWDQVSAFLQKSWTAIKEVAGTVFNGIKNILTVVWNAIKTVTITVWNSIKDFLTGLWNGIKSVASSVWEGIKTAVMTPINVAKTLLTQVWNAIKKIISDIWNWLKNTATNIWNGIKNAIMTPINSAKTLLSTAWNSIKTTASSLWNGIKSTASTVWNGIKTSIMTPINSAKKLLSDVWNGVTKTATDAWNGLKKSASDIFGKIKDAILAPFKNLHIPLPHFKFSTKQVNVAGLSFPVPDVKIDWYKKGGIFTQPSIIGVGEAGPEAVVPIDKLSKIMADTLKKMNVQSASSPTIIVQNMTVRNDEDIYRISRELNGLIQSSNRARGMR